MHAAADASKLGHGDARVPELDGLRGVAIALVVALHVFIRPRMPFWEYWGGSQLASLFDAAWCGVDLFFVLSGFLIGGVILDQRDSPRFFPAFYARRSARILPPYLLLIALAFWPGGPIGIHPSTGQVSLLGYLTFTANLSASTGSKVASGLGPLWSICIEEQFYLFAPLLLRSLSRRWVLPVLAAVVVCSAALRWALCARLFDLPYDAWLWTPTRLDGLALGVIAAWLVREAAFMGWARARPHLLAVGFLIAMAISAGFTQLSKPWLIGPGILCFSLTAAWAIVWLRACPETWLGRALRVRPLVELGRYSYFIYLFHTPARWAFHELFGWAMTDHITIMVLDASGMLLLFALAAGSWRRFEAPLIALGRRVAYGRRPTSIVPVAQS